MSLPPQTSIATADVPASPVSAARVFFRGLAFALPPILTLVILLWIGSAINSFVISPISSAVRFFIAKAVQRTRPIVGLGQPHGLPALPFRERDYLIAPRDRTELLNQMAQGTDRELATSKVRQSLESDILAFVPVVGEQAVPYSDYAYVYHDLIVTRGLSPSHMPRTATGIYMELAGTKFFPNLFNLSLVAVVISIALIFAIGRFVGHRLGRWIGHKAGSLVSGVPLIGALYSAVKQVTDFFFGERERKYHRVVAVEYPRPGMWSLAFVTGEGMPECQGVAGERLVNVLIPSTPLPFAGYTINVKQSDLVDLHMTLDQAFQYVISCGVIVPTPTAVCSGVAASAAESATLPGQSAQPAF